MQGYLLATTKITKHFSHVEITLSKSTTSTHTIRQKCDELHVRTAVITPFCLHMHLFVVSAALVCFLIMSVNKFFFSPPASIAVPHFSFVLINLFENYTGFYRTAYQQPSECCQTSPNQCSLSEAPLKRSAVKRSQLFTAYSTFLKRNWKKFDQKATCF